jgi:hypothetical protein
MGGGEMGQPVPETQQSQQFPGGPQQFPPEQQGIPAQVQHPPTTLPQPASPTGQQAQQQSANPQNGIVAHEIVHPPAAGPGQQPAQQQTPYGLALKPPNPPRITYAGGELTVVANNASLSEILTGIDRLIGAHVEGTRPASERVFGQFGPGTPRAVLGSLLSGSPYDFILVGAIDDPGGVQRIMLTPHGNAALATANTETQPQSSSDQEDAEAATPEPEPPQPIAQPNVVSEQGQQQPVQQVKTPEQLLEELQRLRQQQQQQQATSPR